MLVESGRLFSSNCSPHCGDFLFHCSTAAPSPSTGCFSASSLQFSCMYLLLLVYYCAPPEGASLIHSLLRRLPARTALSLFLLLFSSYCYRSCLLLLMLLLPLFFARPFICPVVILALLFAVAASASISPDARRTHSLYEQKMVNGEHTHTHTLHFCIHFFADDALLCSALLFFCFLLWQPRRRDFFCLCCGGACQSANARDERFFFGDDIPTQIKQI